MLKLYQTSKLDGNIDPYFYENEKDVSDLEVDPLFSWYADVMLVNRKKTILISNELTKFTFIIPEYTKDKSAFEEIFKRYFSYAMYFINVNPEVYLNAFSGIRRNLKVNKSLLAHISRLKEEFVDDMKKRHQVLNFEEFLKHYDLILNERPTTYKNIKGYLEPLKYWLKELEQRKLL